MCLTVFGTFFSIGMQKLRAAGLRQTLMVSCAMTFFAAFYLGTVCLFTDFSFSRHTVLYGMLYGTLYLCTVLFYYFTQQNGPLTYSAFVTLASMIIPTLAGYFLWNEPLGVKTVLGILLFLVSFYFICLPGRKQPLKISKKWLVLAFFTFLFNGSGGVVTKAHQTASNGTQSIQLIAVGYTTAFVCCGIVYLLMLRERQPKRNVQDRVLLWHSIPVLLFVAFGNGTANAGISFLSGRMPAAYLFTVYNGVVQLLITLYSVFVLKERPGKRGWIGMAIGLAGMIMMNI